MKMYRVITEWDMDMGLNVYKSREDAWRHLEEAHESMGEGYGYSFEECVGNNLYLVEELNVVEFE